MTKRMLKQLLADGLNMLGFQRNLGGITKSFAKVKNDLDNHATKKYEEAVVKTQAAEVLNRAAQAAEDEADEARMLAHNISSLLPKKALNGK